MPGCVSRVSDVKTYQAFQQPSRSGDDDEDLLHQLSDEVHLLALGPFCGLTRKGDETSASGTPSNTLQCYLTIFPNNRRLYKGRAKLLRDDLLRCITKEL